MLELLCKKKTIRDFLSLFTENYWKQLITSMLEYGIIIFSKHHKVATLIPEDLIAIVEKLKVGEDVHDKKKSTSKTKFFSPNKNNKTNSVNSYKHEGKINSVKSKQRANKGIRSVSKKSDSRNNSTSSKDSKRFNFGSNIKPKNFLIKNENFDSEKKIIRINNNNSGVSENKINPSLIQSTKDSNTQLKIKDLGNDNRSLKNSGILNINSNNNSAQSHKKNLNSINKNSDINNKNKKRNNINLSRDSSLNLSKNNLNRRDTSNKSKNKDIKFSNNLKEKQQKEYKNISISKINLNRVVDEDYDDEKIKQFFIMGKKNKLNRLIGNNSSDESLEITENDHHEPLEKNNKINEKIELKGMSNYFQRHLSSSSNSDKESNKEKNKDYKKNNLNFSKENDNTFPKKNENNNYNIQERFNIEENYYSSDTSDKLGEDFKFKIKNRSNNKKLDISDNKYQEFTEMIGNPNIKNNNNDKKYESNPNSKKNINKTKNYSKGKREKSNMKFQPNKNKKEKLELDNKINLIIDKPSNSKANIYSTNTQANHNYHNENIASKKNKKNIKIISKIGNKSHNDNLDLSSGNYNSTNQTNLNSLAGEEEFLRSKANNLKLIKNQTENKLFKDSNNKTLPLEQINLNKLKEKKHKNMLEHQNKNVKLDDMKNPLNSNNNKIKIESKIKSQIENDKRKFSNAKNLKISQNTEYEGNYVVTNSNENDIKNSPINNNINLANYNNNNFKTADINNSLNFHSQIDNVFENQKMRNENENYNNLEKHRDDIFDNNNDRINKSTSDYKYLNNINRENQFRNLNKDDHINSNFNKLDSYSDQNKGRDIFMNDKLNILGGKSTIKENNSSYHFPNLSNLSKSNNCINDKSNENKDNNNPQETFRNVINDLQYKNYNINNQNISKNYNNFIENNSDSVENMIPNNSFKQKSPDLSKFNNSSQYNTDENKDPWKNIIKDSSNILPNNTRINSNNYYNGPRFIGDDYSNNKNPHKIINSKENDIAKIQPSNIQNNNNNPNLNRDEDYKQNEIDNNYKKINPQFKQNKEDKINSNINCYNNNNQSNYLNNLDNFNQDNYKNLNDIYNFDKIDLNKINQNNENNVIYKPNTIDHSQTNYLGFVDKKDLKDIESYNTDRASSLLIKQNDILNLSNPSNQNKDFSSQTLTLEDKISGLKQKISNFESKLNLNPQKYGNQNSNVYNSIEANSPNQLNSSM